MDVFLSLISHAKKIHFSFSAQMKPEEYLLFFLVRGKKPRHILTKLCSYLRREMKTWVASLSFFCSIVRGTVYFESNPQSPKFSKTLQK